MDTRVLGSSFWPVGHRDLEINKKSSRFLFRNKVSYCMCLSCAYFDALHEPQELGIRRLHGNHAFHTVIFKQIATYLSKLDIMQRVFTNLKCTTGESPHRISLSRLVEERFVEQKSSRFFR